MKKLSVIFSVFVILICAITVSAQKIEGLTIIPGGSSMLKYGSPDIDIAADKLLETFAPGDIVTVTVEGYGVYDLPICHSYDDVFRGEKLLRASPGKPYVCLAVNYGQFGVDMGILETAPEGSEYRFRVKDGVEFPINVTIEMKEKGGYADRLALGLLTRTKERADYPDLTDAEFANFREIATTGMGAGKLYRASSPRRPDLGREKYADKAAEEAGIRTFINLSDSEAVAKGYEGFEESYYSRQNVIYLALPMDFNSDEFKAGFAKGLRFMIDNEGPYLIHCAEGKDRTGFVCAVLEALMGASPDDIRNDYEKTFTNFYDVKDGKHVPIRPEVLSTIRGIIISNMSLSLGITDPESVDLAKAAEDYLISIGLTADEIAALKSALS